MRERTQAEYDHVRKAVYEQCRRAGKSHAAAQRDAEISTCAWMLPPNTEQPLSAALWLEEQNRRTSRTA